jgi:hypothetical protein
MALKGKPEPRKKPSSKRVVTEIAPGVRALLDAYIEAYNEDPERVSTPLKYTDIINRALDAFLPGKPDPHKEDRHGQGQEEGKGTKAGPGRKGGKSGKAGEGEAEEAGEDQRT